MNLRANIIDGLKPHLKQLDPIPWEEMLDIDTANCNIEFVPDFELKFPRFARVHRTSD